MSAQSASPMARSELTALLTLRLSAVWSACSCACAAEGIGNAVCSQASTASGPGMPAWGGSVPSSWPALWLVLAGAVLQPVRHLHQEDGAGTAALQRQQQRLQRLHRPLVDGVAHEVGGLARRLVRGQPLGQAAQAFDQHHAQRRRQRPHLAQAQLAGLLVGLQEVHQQVLVEGAVGVGDEGPGDPVDARQAVERLVLQHRQRTVVAARQRGVDLRQLRLDEVEVVEQPFRRRADVVPGRGLAADEAVRGAQRTDVAAQPREEGRPRPAHRCGVLRQAQAARMLREPLRAEDLGPQRRLQHAAAPVQQRQQIG